MALQLSTLPPLNDPESDYTIDTTPLAFKKKSLLGDRPIRSPQDSLKKDQALTLTTQTPPIQNNKSSLARRLLADPLVSLAQGGVNLGESAVGLADLATIGRAGKALQSIGSNFPATHQAINELYSPEQQAANTKVQQADGFIPTLQAMGENPSTIPHQAIQSLPLMFGGNAIGSDIAKVAPKLSKLTLGAIGEGALTAGSQAEQIRQQTGDGLLNPKQAAIAAGSGALTGLISRGSGALQNKLGIADADTAFINGGQQTAVNQTNKGFVRKLAEGAISEGLEELPQSAQEQMATNQALGRPLMEGVGNAAAVGFTTGFATGAGMQFKDSYFGKVLNRANEVTPQDKASNDVATDNTTLDVKPGNTLLNEAQQRNSANQQENNKPQQTKESKTSTQRLNELVDSFDQSSNSQDNIDTTSETKPYEVASNENEKNIKENEEKTGSDIGSDLLTTGSEREASGSNERDTIAERLDFKPKQQPIEQDSGSGKSDKDTNGNDEQFNQGIENGNRVGTEGFYTGGARSTSPNSLIDESSTNANITDSSQADSRVILPTTIGEDKYGKNATKESTNAASANADETKQGEKETLLTTDDAPKSKDDGAFNANHELPDGTQVIAVPDETDVWQDANGDEYIESNVTPVSKTNNDNATTDSRDAAADYTTTGDNRGAVSSANTPRESIKGKKDENKTNTDSKQDNVNVNEALPEQSTQAGTEHNNQPLPVSENYTTQATPASQKQAPKVQTKGELRSVQAQQDAMGNSVGKSSVSYDIVKELITRSDGKPFETESKAKQALKNKGLSAKFNADEHDVVPVNGGYAIAPTKNLTFEQFKALPRNSSFSDDVLKQTYETETGKKPLSDLGNNTHKAETTTEDIDTADSNKDVKKSPRMILADELSTTLIDGKSITSKSLFASADKHFGGTQAQGKYSPKDAYDAMEASVNLYFMNHKTGIKASGNVSARVASAHSELLKDFINERLPTQTRRDSEMDELQQFSTPPALAYVANWVANINEGDVMMEPSAGTGDLAVWAKNSGANLILNELSPRRAELLKEVFPDAKIFTENAEQLNNVLPNEYVPDVIVMNPPFSSTAGRIQGKRDTMNGARHVEQALMRLKNSGRLVAIVGNGMAADKPAFKAWWKKISAKYNVRANISVSGKDYAKYGTSFDNNILIIDKTGPTTNNIVTGNVESASKLPELLESIRNDRKPIESKPAQQAGEKDTSTNELESDRPEKQPVGSGSNALGSGISSNTRNDTERSGKFIERTGKTTKKTNEPTDQDGQWGQNRDNAIDEPKGSGGGTLGAIDNINEGGISIESKDSEKHEGELFQSVFSEYKPQRLSIPGAKPHPGNLVQSAAMSAVEPPKPTYTPNLPKEIIIDGKLSIAQLESIVYAGQAHQDILPNGERMGFFIGDGTGVGKGREISGIILDNLRQGRKKAVWISFNEKLINDAKRDFSGIGGDKDKIFWHGKTKAGNELTQKEGILFTTYSTLQSGESKQANDLGQKQGQSRLEQIVKWLGKDFDGVIAFDEAHSMGNAIQIKGKRGFKKPSRQAIAGVNLQTMLPKARIVYVSATGATEVSNLAYASRLGLWGEGTPFPNAGSFIGEISNGGVAAMELIARDMKAMGMYISRSLSFDGVTYQRLEHELTPLQTDIYNELSKAWQIVLQNVEDALNITVGSASGKVRASALSAFWGAHQRFFNQIITSLQTPTVIEDIQKQLDSGNAIVIQLVNTNEATQEREAAKANAQGIELEELDFTPRQMLMEYVKNSFPVQAYEESVDDNGNTISVAVKDANGNPVFDKEATDLRDKLLETLEQIRVPENPIDAIINAFGSENVGEVTGRGRRFVQTRDEEGNFKIVEEKRGKHAAQSDAEAFQNDKKPILIFSQAGGTGFSFHADNSAINQRKRIHYILQPGWRADAAVQGFGRTHRTNQKQPPHYILPTTTLKAQKRFVSSIARRLDQLGALTRGQRQATNQGMFSASDNLESRYASEALEAMFIDMYHNRNGLNFHEVTKSLGLNNLINNETGGLNYEKIPEIPQFLNRLLSLQAHEQDEVFGVFESRMNEIVERAMQNGTYDSGMETLRANSIIKTRDDIAYIDKRTKSETHYVELDATYPIKYKSWKEASAWTKNKKGFVGWFVGEHGALKDKVFAMADLGSRINSQGITSESGVILMARDNKKDTRYIDNVSQIKKGVANKFDHTTKKYEDVKIASPISVERAREMWNDEIKNSPSTVTEKERMLVGVILPIWDRIKGSEKIYRLRTDDGEQMIGRHLTKDAARDTLKNLGLDSEVSKLTTKQLIEKIQNGERALLSNGWEIKQSLVSGEKRLEIINPSKRYFSSIEISQLKEQGAFSERIQWEDRVFIPIGGDKIQVFDRITKSKPVVDFIGSKNKDNMEPIKNGYAYSKYSEVNGTKTPNGISEAQAHAMINTFRAGLNGALDIEFRVYEAPQQAFGEDYDKGLIKGFYTYQNDKNIIGIFTSALNNNKDAIETLRHETIGHFGLNTLSKEDKKAFLQALVDSKNNKEVNKLFYSVNNDYPEHKNSPLKQAEEVFSRAVEANTKTGKFQALIDNLISIIMPMFRRSGIITGFVTNSEIRGLMNTLAENIRKGGQQKVFPKNAQSQFSVAGSKDETTLPASANQGGGNNNIPPDNNTQNASGGNNQNPNNHQSLYNRAIAKVNEAGDWFAKWGTLGSLPEKNKYLAMRYRTLGNLAKVEEISKSVYDTFAKATKSDAEAIYRYLTTKGATIDEIHSVDMRNAAKDVKRAISAIGKQLVDRGYLDEETRQKYDGMYLPRVYLKHILGDSLFTALGSGKTPSDLGYLKQRKDIPEEVRRLILMEIKDPAYLTGRALNIPLRDIAIFDWFNQISDNKSWVWDQSFITIGLTDNNQPEVLILSNGDGVSLIDPESNVIKSDSIQTKRDRRYKTPTFKPIKVKPKQKTRRVTPYFLSKEAERMRAQSHAAPEEDRAEILALADTYEEVAKIAIQSMDTASSPKDFTQMPKSIRYGALAGLVIRKEIYDDVVGTVSIFQGDPSMAQKILGDGGALSRYTSFWKFMKVAANPPSHVRNIMSNLVLLQLSGVSFHRVPQRVFQAINEIMNGGDHWEIAKQYGVTQASFANVELFRMNRELNDLIIRNQNSNSWEKLKALVAYNFGKFTDKASDWYQFMEGVGKVAKIIDELEKGKTPEQAAIAAHEALFDYSLVTPSVRYMRNTPLGTPFASFYVKALPQLVKVAITHPERYLPYYLMFHALTAIVAAQNDVDDDDLEKLLKALPEWLQEKGHAYILPVKDAFGRWQAVDLGYFVPWTMYYELIGEAGRGDIEGALRSVGVLGSPVADLITAIKTGQDSFTRKPIFDKFGTPAEKLGDILKYLYTMNMPTFLTNIGASGKLIEAISGDVDKNGEPKSTVGQALLRFAGVNVYGFDPESTRYKNIQHKKYQMREAKSAWKHDISNPNIDNKERNKITEHYRKTITEMIDELKKYEKDSRIHPNLKLN